MKHSYLKLFLVFCFLLLNYLEAQSYLVNSSGHRTCEGDSIDGSYEYSVNNGPTVNLGSFIDTNIEGVELATMSLKIYSVCNGDFKVFLNGTLKGTYATAGTCCTFETIESNPNITKNIRVMITQSIIASYVIGGVNTLSVTTSNSIEKDQFVFGFEVTVTTRELGVNQSKCDMVKVCSNLTSEFIIITGLNKAMNYRICNVLGHEILNGSISDKDKINIKNISTGLYFLKFENGNTHKFIKK